MRLLKKVIAVSLTMCLALSLSVGASALDRNMILRQTGTNHYLNIVSATAGAISNGTKISTWNTWDASGTQNWTYKTVGNDSALFVRDRPSMVLSYNRVTTEPVLWQQGYDNPIEEYAITVWPDVAANQTINFSKVQGNPTLIVNGARIQVGSQFGYRVNTTTSDIFNDTTRWYIG